jgi:peptidoglycan/xylan/chitin deacetylase (PgdA/CDA1 family)
MSSLHQDNLKHKEIPVMMYHRVVEKELLNSRYNIFATQALLERQIKSFLADGYQLVTFKDLKNKAIERPMILTFDDGYLDNYQNLFPLLKKYNVKAVIFVLTDSQYNHWDVSKGEIKAELMSNDQLLELSNSGLVEIASHGMTHQQLPALSDGDLKIELECSKRKIEEIIHNEVISFSYPWGIHGQREKQAVKDAGYLFGIATDDGGVYFTDDLFAITRVNMNATPLWIRLLRRLKWELTRKL